MKIISAFTIIAGVCIVYLAMNMDVTVEVDKPASAYGISYSQKERVINIGLMDERRNKLIIGGIAVIAGAILLGASYRNQPEILPDSVFCPYCNTEMELDESEIKSQQYICIECKKEVTI